MSNYFLWTNLSNLNNLITNDFKDLIIKEKIFKDFDEYYNLIPSKLNLVEKMLLLEQRFFLTEHNLNYVDKNYVLSNQNQLLEMINRQRNHEFL